MAAPALAVDECPSGLFGVAAQIVRIEPPNATLEKILVSGQKVGIGVDGLICTGEELLVPNGGPVNKVELYVNGHKEVRVPPNGFETPGGTVVFAARALAYLSDVVQGVQMLKAPPDIPRPTSVRGANPTSPVPAIQIHAMRLLRDLPRQRITPNVRPVISWRDGAGPYTCQAISEEGNILWTSTGQDDASWCRLAPDLVQAVQLLVRDSAGQLESWGIKPVAWTEVPRPEWLSSGLREISGADRTAWALWLWRSPDKSWRLQALGMLDEMAQSEWIAGYLRDHLLADSDRFDL